jgi:hypothetical protein
MRHEINLINLKKQKIGDVRQAYIEMNSRYINYVLDFDTELPVSEDDEALGWKDEAVIFNTIFLKEHITSVELSTLPDSKVIVVCIQNSSMEEIKLFYKRTDIDLAYIMRDIILDWLLS